MQINGEMNSFTAKYTVLEMKASWGGRLPSHDEYRYAVHNNNVRVDKTVAALAFDLKYSSFDIHHNFTLFSPASPFHINKKHQFMKMIEKRHEHLHAYTRFHLYTSLMMTRNEFEMGNVGGDVLTLRRYYKSDWEGMFVQQGSAKGTPITVFNYSFDCKHSTKDNWLNIFDAIIKLEP